MIVSENVTLQLDFPITNEKVEYELKEKGIKPLRWAILEVNSNLFTLCVSYEK